MTTHQQNAFYNWSNQNQPLLSRNDGENDMILSRQSIISIGEMGMIAPFSHQQERNGMTYGVSAASYDCRIDYAVVLLPGQSCLGSTLERFRMPSNLAACVHDKSTWARRGLAVQNTFIDPGWEGFLTLELSNHGTEVLDIRPGDPICQLVFHMLDVPTNKPYGGKYQHQPSGPQPAITE